jgi:hypothetical protein
MAMELSTEVRAAILRVLAQFRRDADVESDTPQSGERRPAPDAPGREQVAEGREVP